MENIIQIKCPEELLLGLHLNAEDFANVIKLEAAINLFKNGKISSGLASKWLNIPRVTFLMKAMEEGACLLDNSSDDFKRESAQL